MTTIVLIRKNNEVVVAGDGQVSMGNTVIKSTAAKVRKIEKRNVIAGFAGSTADALTLFERLEAKLEKHAGNLPSCLNNLRPLRRAFFYSFACRASSEVIVYTPFILSTVRDQLRLIISFDPLTLIRSP